MRHTQIERWVEKGIITQEQANLMIADQEKKDKEDTANRFITALSTIGSTLLGVGAILFIASNWREIPDFAKTLILLAATFGSLFAGYFFTYVKKNLPRTGNALIFLSTLLFGATLFLIAQIYHVEANAHWLLIFWMLGITPLAYVFASEAIISLSALLLYIWIPLFLLSFPDLETSIYLFPALFVCISLTLFGLGGFHYLRESYQKMGRALRIFGLQVSLFALYIPTIGFYYDIADHIRPDTIGLFSPLSLLTIIFFILCCSLLAANLVTNPVRSRTNTTEYGIALGVTLFASIFALFPAEGVTYPIAFNLLFAGITIVLIYFGYQKHDIKLINIGSTGLSLYIITKYFDFFWDLLPRSLFFMAGGLVLIFGGIYLERKRRSLKESFAQIHA